MNWPEFIKYSTLLLYTSFVLCVPTMPSIYTFTKNCLGFTVSVAAAIFLIYFLETRPAVQKNLLNRTLICVAVTIILGSSRCFVISIGACFGNAQLQALVESNPIVGTLLSYRYITTAGACFFCALSTERLWLVTQPVTFHKANPNTGGIVVCIVTAAICVVDFTYGEILCFGGTYTKSLLLNFKVEAGIWNGLDINHTINHEKNTTLQKSEDKQLCFYLPIVIMIMFTTIILETLKIVCILILEYRQLLKAKVNKVSHFESKKILNLKQRREHQSVRRYSFPLRSNSPSLKRQRKNSLPIILIEKETKNFTTKETSQNNPTKIDFSILTNLGKEIICKVFLRTASVVTIFFTLGCCNLILRRLTISSFSLVGQLTLLKLAFYVIIVFLIVIDQDIFLFLTQQIKLFLNLL